MTELFPQEQVAIWSVSERQSQNQWLFQPLQPQNVTVASVLYFTGKIPLSYYASLLIVQGLFKWRSFRQSVPIKAEPRTAARTEVRIKKAFDCVKLLTTTQS